MNTNYLHYSDALEQAEPEEQETVAGIVETLRGISETTFKDSGCPLRSVHAKSHALLRGELTVLDNLPSFLRQGMFNSPGTYQVAMRLSTSPGDVLPDSVSTPRGLAIKVVGVRGDRLPGSEDASTQDFVLVNGPAFQAPNAKAFLKSLKMLAATTDKAEGLKKVASAVLRGTEKVIEAVGGESVALKSMGGHPETNPLGETYYSQVPIRYGDYIAKIAVKPVSDALTRLTDAPVEVNGKPNGLREAMIEHFRQHGGVWDVQVQLCMDIESMPIEDASVIWPEDRSPYVTVAKIAVPPQAGWSKERSASLEEGLAFSPWHGLAAHRPLGSVMRARKPAYEMSARVRAEHGKQKISEPSTLAA